VRISLPRVLLASATFHVGLLLAFLFYQAHAHHGRASLTAGPASELALIFTLHTESASDRLVASGAFAPDPNPDGTSAAPLPSTPSATDAAGTAAALALKSDARAHVRRLGESVLNPASAPRVASGDGIVFILDVSGSMYESYAGTTRLAVARQLLTQHIRALRNGVPFALVVYGERAQRSGPLVPANDATREAAVRFINQEYNLGGGTNLPAGLDLAADLNMGGILLATDGDLNMKEGELFPQVRRILGPANESPAFTVLGIAPRTNTDDPQILQDLVARQGGSYVVERADGDPDLAAAVKPAAGP
jgi:Mg-chelatase subunit ChlD